MSTDPTSNDDDDDDDQTSIDAVTNIVLVSVDISWFELKFIPVSIATMECYFIQQMVPKLAYISNIVTIY